jgi:predicted dehydrogenase
MIDAAKKAGKKLMVAYRCRYEPFNKEVIRMVREQELGPVKDRGVRPRLQHRRPEPVAAQARAGGRRLAHGHRHLQPAGRPLHHGEEPTEVNAMVQTTAGDVRFKEVEETINFQLRFPSGALANCTSSYGYAGQNRYRVIGTKGWCELEPATSYHGLKLRVRRGNATEERDLPQRDHFALEMDHMSECVMEGKEPLTPGEEGLRDLKIMMAIYEAAKTRKDGQALGPPGATLPGGRDRFTPGLDHIGRGLRAWRG